MKLSSLVLLLILTSICYSQVRINEMQSSNTATIADNYGEFDDWVEIHNPSNSAVDVAGLVLKDKLDTWQIPLGDSSTIIPSMGNLLLWADDEEFQGKFHTNFKLSAANGEFLGLYETDSVTEIESVTFPPLSGNQSYGKCNGNEWVIFDNATPLNTNDCPISNIHPLEKQGLNIFPTTTKRDITIDLSNYTGGIINTQIYAMNGTLVLNKQYKVKSFTINLSHLRSGMYFIKTGTEKQTYMERIIITQ